MAAATAPVLVGIDGSDAALDAVRWAAGQAVRAHAPLRIVHGFEWPDSPHIGDPGLGVDHRQVLLQRARQWLDEACDAARSVEASLPVTADLRVAHPVELLVHDSAVSRMVVLGCRGLGGFTELLVGSVAVAVAARAACPVAVVRGNAALRDALPGSHGASALGPVVVGVDGSPLSERALDFAFRTARDAGTGLVAVHAWSDFALDPDRDRAAVQEREQALLAERLAGWSADFPEVPVRRVVVRDRPAGALLREAVEADAHLVVVGARGRGGFAGLLLGSTSQALLHHAPCPVVVAREPVPVTHQAMSAAGTPSGSGSRRADEP
ncbi:MAG: universal stress protein [Pseudonocardia sp.]|jgi:nucleotide-binding universal stress UspA family protein